MFGRRSILKAGVAAGLVPALGGLRESAGVRPSRDVMQVMATAKGQAENLLALALFSNLSAESGGAIESASERIFGSITGVVGGIPAEEAVIYSEPSQTMLAEQMTERGVPLVPQAPTPVIPGEPSQPASGELIEVVAAIVKDAFGIKELNASGLAQVDSELGLSGITARIGGMVRANNWALAAAYFRALLSQLSAAAQTVPALQTAIGEQALKELLAGVSAQVRALPRLADPDRFDPVLHQEASRQASGGARQVPALSKPFWLFQRMAGAFEAGFLQARL